MIHPTRTNLLMLKDKSRSIVNSIGILKARKQALIKEFLDKELGWTNEQFGWVNSAFQLAYGAGLLGFGYYLQYFDNQNPCPLCLVQRGFYYGVILAFAAAALHNPGALGHRLYCGAGALSRGASIATRQPGPSARRGRSPTGARRWPR